MKQSAGYSHMELLSLLCLLMILCEQVYDCVLPFADEPVFGYAFRSLLSVGIPCLFIAIGYRTLHFRLRHFVRLVLEMLFFSLVFTFTSVLLGNGDLHLGALVYAFVPFVYEPYWLMTAYLLLYLLAPLLNTASLKLSRVAFLVLMLLGFGALYLVPAWLKFAAPEYPLLHAHSRLVHVVYFYFLGRYFKLHSLFLHRRRYYLILFFFSVLLITGEQFLLKPAFSPVLHKAPSLLVFLGALALFFAFARQPFRSARLTRLAQALPAVFLLTFAPGVCGPVLLSWVNFLADAGIPSVGIVLLLPLLLLLTGFAMDSVRRSVPGRIKQGLMLWILQRRWVQYLWQDYRRLTHA